MDPKLLAVIEKVKRLRALATSSNVNEAANAAAAADKLLQEYRLSEAELESTNGPLSTRETANLDPEPIVSWNRRVTSWQSSLSAMLARHYSCSAIVDNKNNPKILVVGRPSDISTVRYMYSWLSLEISRLSHLYCKGYGKSYSDSFCKGAVVGIREAMFAAEKAVRAQQTSQALTIVDRRAIESRSKLEQIYPNLRSRHSTGATHSSAFHNGMEKGRSISNRNGLPSNVGPRQLKE